jgi:phosphate transport system permease protein
MSNYAVRRLKDRLFFVLGAACIVLAVLPLGSILLEVIAKGLPTLSLKFLMSVPGPGGANIGGVGPAIEGSLILIGLTCLIGIPLGVLSGIYLAEYGDAPYARVMRTLNDVLTEFPSIVVGLTVFIVVVLREGGSLGLGFSPLSGAIALSFILIPIVARTAEEAIKLVPNALREASMALGVRKWRTTLSIVLGVAKAGLVTGILLAVARVAGETAPLLLTVLGNTHFFEGFNEPIAALPLQIYQDALAPDPGIQARAWGAALVLILVVLSLNIVVRLATRGRMGSSGRK